MKIQVPDLLPCPCCAKPAKWHNGHEWKNLQSVKAICLFCGIQSRTEDWTENHADPTDHTSKNQARLKVAKVWNTRP